MALTHPRSNHFAPSQPAASDPFAMQLALSSVHARLVPMRRETGRYSLDLAAENWSKLPAGRGFAGYGLGRALRMLLDVLRGLTALHDTFDALGEVFVHGDVSVIQLRVDSEGVCRVVPLTARHASTVESTPGAEAVGHLAPERLLGEKLDIRADVFSAGVLLWEALAGRRLFDESTGEAIIDRLMAEKLQMPQLPPELAWAIPLKAVAARALAVDPYQRFADCAELATAIAIVARERVASHAEIANFFGAPQRTVERRARDSVPPTAGESALSALLLPPSAARSRSESSVSRAPGQPRPVPSQSSTFVAVSVPSSRRPSTLAPLGPARSLTPPPTSKPVPAPASVRSISRSEPHLSPFSTLLGVEARSPLSEPQGPSLRSTTLTSLGTPRSVREPLEAADETSKDPEASPALRQPPPLPEWAQLPNEPSNVLLASKSTLSAVVSPGVEPEPQFADEVLALRGWSAARTWSVIAVLALTAVIAIVAITQSGSSTDPVTIGPSAASPPIATATASVPRSNFNRPGYPGSSFDESPAAHPDAAASAKGSLAPRSVGKPPPAAKPNAKDYGI